ncbi:MAG: DUF1684 domain-containing protein [Candidatus Acidiferrum sp.]
MKIRSLRRRFRWLTLAVLPLAITSFADDSPYRKSVEKWRQDYQTSLTSDTGWLTVSGLFWLHEGENRFGSDPGNDFVLPPSAPAYVGVFEFHSGKTTVRIAPGVPATLNGKPVQAAELRRDSREDHLVLGDFTLYVHASGNRFAIRMKDKNSKLRKNFAGLNWFPIDESYRVTARYVPYDSPKQLDSQNVLGDPIKLDIVGYLTFSLHGQNFRLDVESNSDGGFFIVFRDLTSGKETYPASRFIDTDPPKEAPNGKTVDLDFNKAYNPPCAYNPYTTCPLPLPGNRLGIAIPAGEKLYKHDHGA